MEVKIKYYDSTITWEESSDDISTDELLDLFVKFMYMMGFHHNSIIRAIKELAEGYEDRSDIG